MSRSYKIIFLGLIILFLFVPAVGTAYGPEVWTNLGIYGGDVEKVAIDPNNPDNLFAGIWFGDGLYRSLDGTDSWQASRMEERFEGEDTFENQVVLDLTISPSNTKVVWVTHNYWVAKSNDGGDTWTHIPNSTVQRDCVNCGGSEDNFRFCYALAADPTDANIAYLGTAGAWSTYEAGAIYRTADGGITWEKLNQGRDLEYPVVSLAVDPALPQVIWAATTNFGIGGSWDGIVYRSSDSGQSWVPIDPQPFSNSGLETVTPHPNNADVVFVSGGAGVARGEYDGSTSWNYTYPVEGSALANGLVFSPSDDRIAYVGWNTPIEWGGDGLPKVSRSEDGGLTWQTSTLASDIASNPKTLAVHPTNPETVFLGDSSGGVLKSLDHGQTWVQVSKGINGIVINDVAVDANDTTHIIAATNGGVYDRTDQIWKLRLRRNAESINFVPGSSSAYYAGLYAGLARTDDGGTTWTIRSDIAQGWVEDIAIDPMDNRIVFIADKTHVRRSTNGGDSFEALLEGINLDGESHTMNTLAFDPFNSNHIYAGGGNFRSPKVVGDLWESLDGGDTWQRTGLNNVIVNKVIVDPRNANILYAGCGYSDNIDTPLFKSMDAGANWENADNGLPLRAILLRSVWAEAEDNVYAAGGNSDILRFDGNSVNTVYSGGIDQTVNLSKIYGFDANTIFTVGGNGTILRFDGSAWVPMQSGTTEYLTSIWGTTPDDLFAVGVSGTILHFDGNAWTPMDSGTTKILSSVFGTSSNNVYAVGYEGTILHYDGSGWSTMPSSTTNNLYSVWAATKNAIFAGGTKGTLIFFNGTVWSPMTSGTEKDISDIWGTGINNVHAVTQHEGQILHFGGTSWTLSSIPDATVLSSIWGLPNGTYFVTDERGGYYRNIGGEWETLRPAGSRFRSVTDLAFNLQNPDVVYASTWQAGVFISPNEAGNWLNLGIPTKAVNAISSGSLFAATTGGLYQLTGTGVISGYVYDQNSHNMLDDAQVTTDLGIKNRTINGLYMMVLPAGYYDVHAAANNYGLEFAENVEVYGAEVTSVNFDMAPGLGGIPPGTVSNQTIAFGSSSGGGACFFQTVSSSALPLNIWLSVIGLFTGFFCLLFAVSIHCKVIVTIALAVVFSFSFSPQVFGFTIFEQIGLASAPSPVGSGARAQGFGGAFIAIADDATAASWNPAGLIQLEKPELSVVGAYVNRRESFSSNLNSEINNTGSVSYSELNYASGTFPLQLFKNLVVSLNYQRLFEFKRNFKYQRNVTAPGVNLNQQIRYDQDGFVSAYGLAGALEITPRLSVGATINFWTDQLGCNNGWTENYNEIATGTQAGVPVTIKTAIVDNYEQFRGINFNLGLLWDTGKLGNFGVVVKTPFTATIQHRFRFYQTSSLGNPINSDTSTGPINVEEEVELEMPFSYGIGWSKRFKDTFTVSIDLYRTEWGNYTLTNGKGEEFSPIDGRPKSLSNVKATTHVRLGSEYLFLLSKHKIAIPVRAGIFYDPEPSEGNPNDVFGFALGSGLTFQQCSLDLAYQLRWAKDVDAGNLIANSTADITQHTVLASIIYYF